MILDEKILLLAKASILVVLGILIGYLMNKALLKLIDFNVLKKMFGKDVPTYETSIKITKVICLIIQLSILLLFINYAFVLLSFNLISNAFSYILAEIPKISLFILLILSGFLIAKIIAGQIKRKHIRKKEEIALVVEFIIISAFFLTGLEYIGLKATAMIELFKIMLYVIAATIIILIIKPDFFENQRKSKK